MKIQKRFVVRGSMALVTMVLALGIAGTMGCAKFRCGPPFGPFAGDIPGSALKRLDSKIEELNLTPAQKTKYDELRACLSEHLTAAKEGRREFRETVRNELTKESPDMAALNAMMKKKIAGISGTLQKDLDLFASFYSTLDESQKQKVLAGIRKKMAAIDACREEGR